MLGNCKHSSTSFTQAPFGEQQTSQPVNHMTTSNYDQTPSVNYLDTNTVSQSNQDFCNSQRSNSASFRLFSESNVSHFQTDQSLQPLDHLREESEGSKPSTWDGVWDQGLPKGDNDVVDSSTKPVLARTESARRRQFYMMKDESSCLPSLQATSCSSSACDKKKTFNHDFNENELMKGSLVSMDMHSSSGSSGDFSENKKSGTMESESRGEFKSKSTNMMETTMSMNDIRMDSLMTSLTSMIMAD